MILREIIISKTIFYGIIFLIKKNYEAKGSASIWVFLTSTLLSG